MNRRLKVQRDREEEHEIERIQVSEDARDFAEAKWQEKQMEETRKTIGERLLPMMQKLGIRKHRVDFDELTNADVTVKIRETPVWNEERLKKLIGAANYRKLTTEQLDLTKVEAAIRLGELDPNVVAQCMETSESPYLECRFTQKRRTRRAGT